MFRFALVTLVLAACAPTVESVDASTPDVPESPVVPVDTEALASFVHACDLDAAESALDCVVGKLGDVDAAIDACGLAAGLEASTLEANRLAAWSGEEPVSDEPAVLDHYAAVDAMNDARLTFPLPCRVTTVENEVAHPLLETVWPLQACE